MNDKRRIKNPSTNSYKHITEKPADLINYSNRQTVTRSGKSDQHKPWRNGFTEILRKAEANLTVRYLNELCGLRTLKTW